MRPRHEIVKELNKKLKSQIARRPEDLLARELGAPYGSLWRILLDR
jgi:hypothetical protein